MSTKIVTIDLGLRSYDIFIGSGLLYRSDELIPDDLEGRSVFVITDENVKPYAEKLAPILEQGGAREVALKVLPAGEATKSFANVQSVSEWMLENGLNRNSIVFAIGGGVIGDLGGFCAAIAMRGVPYVQIPTSLLAQVDSSVGGKTGINTPQGKNLIGNFYQPTAVLADLEVLKTLPKRELLAGYAEVAKYGLINDLPFFEWLEQGNGEKVCRLDEEALKHAIETCCKAKAAIVEADEQENGKRALLNLGHTFGHALETSAGYNGTLLHGEGVAIGIVLAYELSAMMGLCSQDDIARVENHFQSVGLPTRVPSIPNFNASIDGLMNIMRKDKKVTSGKMVFILANAIGDTFVSRDVEEENVREVLRQALGGEKINTAGKGGLAQIMKTQDMKQRWKSAFSQRS
ncbi:MAG: 3-dehydroquinate synthase [Alphaproteobacteria bacterium]